jgi:hypothetical protein
VLMHGTMYIAVQSLQCYQNYLLLDCSDLFQRAMGRMSSVWCFDGLLSHSSNGITEKLGAAFLTHCQAGTSLSFTCLGIMTNFGHLT